MRKRISIHSFPQDKIVRVLYRYGGLQKSTSFTGTSIHIHVLLAEIDENTGIIKKKFTCTSVKLNELSKATIGSVWEGQLLKSHEFNFNNRILNRYLIFNLNDQPAINMKFNSVKKYFKDTHKLEILNYFNLSNSEIINKNSIYNIENFNSINYAKLRSTKNDNVFISSIDILNTLFSRDSKVKESILYKSPLEMVNDYFESFTPLKKHMFCYKATIRNDIKKPSENTINFISALAYNKEVQNNLQLIQSSLENIDYNLFNHIDTVRFPIILPPQTGQLIIKAQGFSNYNNFYVTKIKRVVSSSFYTLVLHQFNKDLSPNNNKIYHSE